jgi:hypothetical protein
MTILQFVKFVILVIFVITYVLRITTSIYTLSPLRKNYEYFVFTILTNITIIYY